MMDQDVIRAEKRSERRRRKVDGENKEELIYKEDSGRRRNRLRQGGMGIEEERL